MKSDSPATARNAYPRAAYPTSNPQQPDLRLRNAKTYPIPFTIDPTQDAAAIAERISPIPFNPNPEIDYRQYPFSKNLRCGNRLTEQLLSYFPRAKTGALALDLGCGGQPFKPLCEQLGFEYVGIDYSGDAMLLADAHALPFKAQSFDFVISFAVLEHLRNPFIVMRELLRVLKPGARFIGTVAFLEPFHLNSYYHTSPLGTYDLLSSSGFAVEQIEANVEWQGLQAISRMSLFPHAPPIMANLAVLPLQMLHRAWWKMGSMIDPRPATSEHARQITNTAGFRFVCRKP